MSLARPVAVGIDGSQPAVDAAIWAVKEALSRGVPLRLIYAVDPDDNGADHESSARALATAELAIRQAYIAVQATELPVRIELEVIQDKPIAALTAASRNAALLCVGASGFTQAGRGGIGSVASAVVKSAHCPVAIVATPGAGRRILVEFDGTPAASAALQTGVDEARLRDAPLSVVTTWQHRHQELYDGKVAAERNRLAQAQLDRRLIRYRRRHPDLDVELIADRGRTVDHLSANPGSVQLIVVGAERIGECSHGPGDQIDLAGLTGLVDAGCSLLTCDRLQRL
jgi:nucleotide-binding universal stress UspA family protein